jgi:hypothetical protein
MIVIDIDPHKRTHTATAVDPAGNTDLGSATTDAEATHSPERRVPLQY